MVMRISLSEENSKFTFSVSSAELNSAISRAASVISSSGSNVKNFVLLAIKSKLVLLAFNPDTYVYLVLPSGSAAGSGSFAFLPATMQGVIKGRGDMEFKFTGGECEFKLTKGRYSGKFTTIPVTSDQVAAINSNVTSKKSESEDSSVIPRHVLDVLKEGISMTSIHDVYTQNSLLSYMSLDAKGTLTVSAYDNHHFGYYCSKVESNGVAFKAALPSSHFLVIEKLVEDEDVKFYIRDKNIRVEGENFMIILPSTQTEEANYTRIREYIKSLDKPAFHCEYNNDALAASTDNLFSLHEINTMFELGFKKGSKVLDITFATPSGSASDSLKVKTLKESNVKSRVDPRLLKDILPLLRGQQSTELSIVPGKVLRFDCKPKNGGAVTLISTVTG